MDVPSRRLHLNDEGNYSNVFCHVAVPRLPEHDSRQRTDFPLTKASCAIKKEHSTSIGEMKRVSADYRAEFFPTFRLERRRIPGSTTERAKHTQAPRLSKARVEMNRQLAASRVEREPKIRRSAGKYQRLMVCALYTAEFLSPTRLRFFVFFLLSRSKNTKAKSSSSEISNLTVLCVFPLMLGPVLPQLQTESQQYRESVVVRMNTFLPSFSAQPLLIVWRKL